jgi:hypothetical protein
VAIALFLADETEVDLGDVLKEQRVGRGGLWASGAAGPRTARAGCRLGRASPPPPEPPPAASGSSPEAAPASPPRSPPAPPAPRGPNRSPLRPRRAACRAAGTRAGGRDQSCRAPPSFELPASEELSSCTTGIAALELSCLPNGGCAASGSPLSSKIGTEDQRDGEPDRRSQAPELCAPASRGVCP